MSESNTIVLHHLNQSRSLRILWLLEEIQVPYALKKYYRDAKTHLAPQNLKDIHPLGKSPVIEFNGKLIAESGAIVEFLIQKHAPSLAPQKDSDAYIDYLQWIHFSESSAMVPYLLKVFYAMEQRQGTELKFLDRYAEAEFDKVFGYLNQQLQDKQFLLGNYLTGADFMLGFVVYGLVNNMNIKQQYPHIVDYLNRLTALDSWQRAMKIEMQMSE